jgi:hypothetical protein
MVEPSRVELLRAFTDPIREPTGNAFVARAYGHDEAGTWYGWIAFFPSSGRAPLVTDHETTQPSLAALSYWASGLTHVYLEGALERAKLADPKRQLLAIRKRLRVDRGIEARELRLLAKAERVRRQQEAVEKVKRGALS